MRKSFYTWLMTERNPKSNAPKAILADLAFHESAFPLILAILMPFGKNTKPTRKGQVEDGFFSASLL